MQAVTSAALTMTANPDTLSLDGFSQTLITVEARDNEHVAVDRIGVIEVRLVPFVERHVGI